ncbi:MAG: hypothetical protein AAFW82_03225 [Pseudomonadota bacterium]
MPLFGSSSRSSTSQTSNVRQSGAEGTGNISAAGNVTTNFDDNIAETVNKALDGAFGIATQSAVDFQKSTGDVLSSISTIAEREKSPETAWLPFAVIGGVAVIAIAIWGRRA